MFTNLSTFNIADPMFKANPYPMFAHLRMNAPVLRLPSRYGMGNMWLITRYKDAVSILKDERFIKNGRSLLSPQQLAELPATEFDIMDYSLLANDGETHRRLRSLVHKAFTPQLIEHLHPRIENICAELLDKVTGQGHMDLIADYAFPLPIIVICEMLGVPSQDRDNFRKWSNILLNDTADIDETTLGQAMTALVDYLRSVIDDRRKHPQDDLITRLVEVEEAGDQLSELELLAMVFLLLIAGHETTVNLIGSGMLALLQHPTQLQKLRNEPSLIKTAIEELLRYTSPVENSTERYPNQDIEFNGVLIARGELVLVSLSSANRDPEQFANPEALDITRTDNKHIAFGFGVHYCLGAPLARMEGAIAIPMLLERMRTLKLAIDPSRLKWRQSFFMRGVESLPVTF
jgi:cytochrome P450